ncbi:hypothetical protein Pint_28670 [Pistacia integerrima]|uniref:Uncharacterized protein n=1 Tax=Pistacia integerrima TaxID=434235 RepID=A0ACC0YP54_9ROSI|nr:hypothetical protein Pint_28670 [Pistacia integerrima]
MLFNFDKLVSVIGWLIAFCDNGTTTGVKVSETVALVGLLAFHQALVSNPQDAFVIWVFASVLYNGKWEEVVKIAREHAKDQVNFAPEISGFLKLNQMKNLSELASLVQDCVNALNETHSGVCFKEMGWMLIKFFDALVNSIESYNEERENFMIDYHLLGKGIYMRRDQTCSLKN